MTTQDLKAMKAFDELCSRPLQNFAVNTTSDEQYELKRHWFELGWNTRPRPTEGERGELDGELWSAIRTLLSQGGTIYGDFLNKPFEEYSVRLDVAARERVDWLKAKFASLHPSSPSSEVERVSTFKAGYLAKLRDDGTGLGWYCGYCGEQLEFVNYVLIGHKECLKQVVAPSNKGEKP